MAETAVYKLDLTLSQLKRLGIKDVSDAVSYVLDTAGIAANSSKEHLYSAKEARIAIRLNIGTNVDGLEEFGLEGVRPILFFCV